MAKKKTLVVTSESMADYIGRLIGGGLGLIPLDPGSKATHEPQWASRPTPKDIPELAARCAPVWGLTVEQAALAFQQSVGDWIASMPYNLGVLHEASRTVCLDMDHPAAMAALQAGVQASGGPAGYLPGSPFSWMSPRGRKWLWWVPAGLGGRSARQNARQRLPNGKVEVSTVLEIRGTGQDVIPYAWRADRDFRLTWATPDGHLPQGVPLPFLPPEMAHLMQALLEGDQRVAAAMQTAAGVPVDMQGLDATHTDDYPARLAGRMHERMAVNANHEVEALLTAGGYVETGNRWRKPGSSHAGGITRPAAGRKMWHCWHEGDPLAGQFDAWRVWVEVRHGGDLAAAITEARSIGNTGLRVVPAVPVAAGDPQGTSVSGSAALLPKKVAGKKAHISSDEKMVRRGKIPSDEMPTKAPKTAQEAPKSAEARGVPGKGHGAILDDLPGKAPSGPASASERGVGRVGPTSAPQRTGGASTQAEEAPGGGEPEEDWGVSCAADLYQRDLTDPVPFLTGTFRLSTGTFNLAGKPKSGKSWLALGIGLLVSGSLDTYAGLRTARTGRVLYIGVDDSSETRMARRIKATMGERAPNNLFEWAEQWPPASMSHLGRVEALERYIVARKPAMVVIDTWVAFRPSERTQAVVQEEYDELKLIHDLGVRYGLLIVLVMHLNKGKQEDPDEPFQNISGSSAVQAAVDGNMVLIRVHSEGDDARDHRGGLWVRTRDYEEDSAGMELKAGAWRSLDCPARAMFTYGTRRAIEEHLLSTQPDQWASAAEVHLAIADQIDAKLPGVRKALQRMAAEGVLAVHRSTVGGYRLTGERRAALMAARGKF
jgi:hypothetical protein